MEKLIIKLFKLLTVVFFLSSCSNKIIPIKGSYPQTPIIVSSEKPFEEVWDKLINVFAQKGLSIKLIDKSSGLIISDNSLLSATIENKKGIPENSSAVIVVPQIHNVGLNMYVPIVGYTYEPKTNKILTNPVYGEWNVRIQKTGNSTLINVNLVNLKYVSTGQYNIPITQNLNNFKTTGKFENIIIDLIK